MRAEPDIAQTQVIFYTATYRIEEAKSLADACGISMVLPKPSEPRLILDTVNADLQKSKPPRADVAAVVEKKGQADHAHDRLALVATKQTSRQLLFLVVAAEKILTPIP